MSDERMDALRSGNPGANMNKHLYSVSEILTYQRCPTKWAFSYYLGRTKRKQSTPALWLGTAGHQTMENLFNGLDWNDAVPSVEPDMQAKFNDILYTICGWWSDGEKPWIKVLGVEEEDTIDIDQAKLRTKTDLVVLDQDGRIWHVQWKFLDPKTNLPDFFKVQERSLHETSYALQLQKKYPQYEYAGTLLYVFLKNPRHERAKGEDCGCNTSHGKGYRHRKWQDSVHLERLLVSEEKQQSSKLDLKSFITDIGMAKALLVNWHPEDFFTPNLVKCETACRFNQSSCEFLDVCALETPVTNELLFEDRDPTGHYSKKG